MATRDPGEKFQLRRHSPFLVKATSRGRRLREPEVYAPRRDAVRAGDHGFAIDCQGQLWLSRSADYRHASRFGSRRIAAVGRVRVNARGEVAFVACVSDDFDMRAEGPEHVVVRYVVEHFADGADLTVSPHALFRFWSVGGERFEVDLSATRVRETRAFFAWLDRDDPSELGPASFDAATLAAFADYRPQTPPLVLLRPLRQPGDEYEPSPPADAYGTQGTRRVRGVAWFVIDVAGVLIVGDEPPLELAGGRAVAAAGTLRFDAVGLLTDVAIGDEFAHSARFARASLEGHPLLKSAPGCRWTIAQDELAESLRWSEPADHHTAPRAARS